MKPRHYATPSFAAFGFTFVYLIYLSLICQTVMIYDSIGYEQLGRRLYTDGFGGYVLGGPEREPLYPLFLAGAMRLSDFCGIDYAQIQKWMQVGLLMLTQVLAYV